MANDITISPRGISIQNMDDSLIAVVKACLGVAHGISLAPDPDLLAPDGSTVFSETLALRSAFEELVKQASLVDGGSQLVALCDTFQAAFIAAAKAYV